MHFSFLTFEFIKQRETSRYNAASNLQSTWPTVPVLPAGEVWEVDRDRLSDIYNVLTRPAWLHQTCFSSPPVSGDCAGHDDQPPLQHHPQRPRRPGPDRPLVQGRLREAHLQLWPPAEGEGTGGGGQTVGQWRWRQHTSGSAQRQQSAHGLPRPLRREGEGRRDVQVSGGL